MDAVESFGGWLRAARRTRDLSREALAELASCAVPTLAKIEQGTRRPSRELASLLLDVLQVDPGERERVLRLARLPLAEPSRQPEPFANRSAAPKALSTLPAAPSPLVGRAAELQLLREQLATPSRRAITLIGPGGVGKTRLALEIATELGPCYADGVAWVALADVGGAEGVGPAIAAAAGCPLRGDEPLDTRLIAYLRERRMLLVLDNLEHLLAATPLLDTIVRCAPGVTLLSTSRERLGLAGEWLIELDGLAVPGPQAEPALERYDATLLFITRAQQAGGARAPDSANREAIAQICRLLEGVPLAIELAATWTRVLSCVELAAELAQGLALLATTAAHTPPRHRSMRAVFAHSWGLLGDDERRALAALSVFTGGFTRTAAERVAQVSLGVLAGLVEKSLLRRRELAGHSRYLMHELVRQYAAERLAPDEARALGARHSAFYAELLAASLPDLQAGPQAQALTRLEGERANIRQAWGRAVEQDDEPVMLRCAPGLLLMHELRGQLREASALFGGAVARRRAARTGQPLPGADRALGVLCAWEGWARGRSGEVRASYELLAEAVALLDGDDDLLAATGVLGSLGLLLLQRGKYAEARAVLERSLALTPSRRLWFFATLHAVFLVNVLLAEGELAAAQHWAATALTYADSIRSPRAHLLARCASALAANLSGAPARGEEHARTALARAAAAGDPFGVALALLMLGQAARLQAQRDEARYLLAESAEACEGVGDRWNQARALVQLGMVEHATQDVAAAGRAWREALRVSLGHGIDGVALTAAVELAALAAAARPAEALDLLSALGARPEADAAARARISAVYGKLATALPAVSPAAPSADEPLAAVLSGHPAISV